MYPENSEDNNPELDEGSRNKSPKSGRSVVSAFVRFVNRSIRKVDLIWLNYEGARIKYKTLNPRQFVDVNTFVGHPWLFRDSETGDRLVVQLKEVYEASSGWSTEDGWPPKRKVVNITIPVYTLKEKCLQDLRHLIQLERIDELILPMELKDELRFSCKAVVKTLTNQIPHVT